MASVDKRLFFRITASICWISCGASSRFCCGSRRGSRGKGSRPRALIISIVTARGAEIDEVGIDITVKESVDYS